MSTNTAESNLRLLPGLDAEIDELLAIRASMVTEIREAALKVRDRRIVEDEDES